MKGKIISGNLVQYQSGQFKYIVDTVKGHSQWLNTNGHKALTFGVKAYFLSWLYFKVICNNCTIVPFNSFSKTSGVYFHTKHSRKK